MISHLPIGEYGNLPASMFSGVGAFLYLLLWPVFPPSAPSACLSFSSSFASRSSRVFRLISSCSSVKRCRKCSIFSWAIRLSTRHIAAAAASLFVRLQHSIARFAGIATKIRRTSSSRSRSLPNRPRLIPPVCVSSTKGMLQMARYPSSFGNHSRYECTQSNPHLRAMPSR